MGLTITLDANTPVRIGKRKMSTGTVLFDASYPTNGEAITASDVGFYETIEALVFLGGLSATQRLDWLKTTSKVKVYTEVGGTFAEHTNGTDPGISAARFMAWGW